MEITEAHARELEKQGRRKTELLDMISQQIGSIENIVFEAGCGHGHWLTEYAEIHPDECCVGIDLISWRIRKGTDKRDKRNLSNLHFFKAELGEFLEVLPKSIRFDFTVLLFPDPWPKAKHHRRRMVQNGFLDIVAERTAIGGRFCFRSDDLPYYDWTIEHLENHPKWQIDCTAEWPHEGETYFQKLMDGYHSVVAVRK